MTDSTSLTCACGQVQLQLVGAPIMRVECCCESCRKAALLFESLPGAPKLQTAHDTTPFVMYRKDRVQISAGQANLREHRLKPESPSRRIVATCCNTPLFLDFTSGHWLSFYSTRFAPDALPPLLLRTMAADLPAGGSLPDDVPNLKTHNARFFVKLLSAWVAMGFRIPGVEGVQGALVVPAA